MPVEPQRQRADCKPGKAGHEQRKQQSDPRRQAHRHGRPGGGVGGDADKGSLSERRHAADPGQQHQPERDQRGDADIIEQRDGEAAEQRGRDQQRDDGAADQAIAKRRAQRDRVGHLDFLSRLFGMSGCLPGLPEQHGDQEAEDDHFLEGTAPERSKTFHDADQHRAERCDRIAGEAADDGADEGFQPDHEAGIVIDRRGRPDQDGGNAGQ